MFLICPCLVFLVCPCLPAGVVSYGCGRTIAPGQLAGCFIAGTKNQYQVDHSKLEELGECQG